MNPLHIIIALAVLAVMLRGALSIFASCWFAELGAQVEASDGIIESGQIVTLRMLRLQHERDQREYGGE